MMRPAKDRLTITLLGTLGAVALGSALMPAVRGYGTVLFQFLALAAWQTVAIVTDPLTADRSQPIVWMIAVTMSLFVFAIPALLIWAAFRTRWLRAGIVLLIAWCGLYLFALYLLFPASDGP